MVSAISRLLQPRASAVLPLSSAKSVIVFAVGCDSGAAADDDDLDSHRFAAVAVVVASCPSQEPQATFASQLHMNR